MSRLNSKRSEDTICVRYTIGGDGGSSVFTTTQANWELCQRGLVAFPGDVLAMRLRVRNRTINTDTDHPNDITIPAWYLGRRPLFDAAHWWTGRFKVAPDSVFPSFVVPGGGEGVSAWVTTPSLMPRKGVIYGYSMPIQAPTSGTVIAQGGDGGLVWGATSTSMVGVSQPAQAGAARRPLGIEGEIASPFQYFDVRLEVVMRRIPILTGIGDSIFRGHVNETDVYGYHGGTYNYEAAAGMAGLLGGFAVQNIAVGGSNSSQYAGVAGTDWRYQRLDWRTSPPDVVVLQHGTNDIGGLSATAAQLEGTQATIMDTVRGLAPRAKILLTTIIPNNFGQASSQEAARTGYNAWARGLPYGAAGCVDWDNALNPAGTPLAGSNVVGDPKYLAAADPHPFRAAQSVMARCIPVIA